jgi:hypothetical protein
MEEGETMKAAPPFDWPDPGPVGPHLPKYPFDAEYGTRLSKKRRWEHLIVGKLLSHYGIVEQAAVLTGLVGDATGIPFLALEAFQDLPLRCQFGADGLQGDIALEFAVARVVYGAHATPAKQSMDLIAAKWLIEFRPYRPLTRRGG